MLPSGRRGYAGTGVPCCTAESSRIQVKAAPHAAPAVPAHAGTSLAGPQINTAQTACWLACAVAAPATSAQARLELRLPRFQGLRPAVVGHACHCEQSLRGQEPSSPRPTVYSAPKYLLRRNLQQRSLLNYSSGDKDTDDTTHN